MLVSGVKTEYFSLFEWLKGIFVITNQREVIMKKLIICSAVLFLFFSAGMLACSKDGKDGAEKGKIEKTVDKMADDSVKGIHSAIDKAKAISRKAEKKVEELDETFEDE